MSAENIIKEGAILGSLSGSALLGLMVFVLAGIVWHLYRTLHKEAQERTKELIIETKNTNVLIREQITVSKASNDSLIKFIQTHCSKTNDKLEAIETDLMRMDERLVKLTQIRNDELKMIYKRKENE
ncbi:hypothetical protein C3I17_03350 [Campylobacter jejuni]|uniref:hypothetical protein n=1 Tax=Campylobacter jejuni TaxID=197 RepID=UPI000F810A34|nr:hypothetical protein [Campylobacter jejuni]RTI61398.1 hypothetical protein C3I17_03350 [Campylobacter jejuni]RTI99616.1 hypothetical protein C3H95_04855 [Campylobacter jejuni]HEG3339334.1 hypothetical protein [Campylobacter jejuni]